MAASQTKEFAVFTTTAHLDKLCCKSLVKLDEVLFPSQILVLRALFPLLFDSERAFSLVFHEPEGTDCQVCVWR